MNHIIRWLASALWVIRVSWPASANAHGFGERYDLPIPLSYFVAGACATVLLTFIAVAMMGRNPPDPLGASRAFSWRVPRLAHVLCQVVGLGLLGLTTWAAWAGTGDPLMNFAPTWIWIAWWIGLSLFAALVGNLWPALDPWRTSFEWMQALARHMGCTRTTLGWSWPKPLGVWPAVVLLLGWSWLEVVYALPSSPHRVGVAIVIFSMAQWIGMGCFGREVWQGHADVFALYFAQLGRLALVRASPDGRHLILCRPAPMPAATARAGEVGFVFAMLATVLFDGLHGSAPWLMFQAVFDRGVPRGFDVNGYIAGGLGLVLIWLCLTLAYGLTCHITSRWLKTPSATQIAHLFIPALLPIAVGYLVAHNFSGLIIQGQHLLSLASDPLGRQWNLWGTAGRPIDIGLIDAATTWYVALTAIVLGHGVSVWVSHRLALTTADTPAAATRLCVPLTVLMIGYTALSLVAIAEPLV